MLELKNITKGYWIGGVKQNVLKGINLRFRRNEFVSILGASGSGKTTLLNIIGGLDIYDSGELFIEGITTQEYRDSDWDSYRNHRVGFIFQSYNLIMHQTIISNVEIALTLSGVSKKQRRKRAIETLEKVGLKDHIYKRPSQLSGGQMQRVAIARALVNDPEIILADEPTGALDSETSLQIMELLKEIAQEKLVIMVTHNPELADLYSNRIITLKDGLVIHDSHPFEKEGEVRTKRITRTSISFLTSLSLSFHNLLTKKGRTFLTSFAGSIGIIGIALILSLSNGVNQYVSSMERESLSNFPIVLEKDTYDFSKLFYVGEEEKIRCEDGQICSEDDVTKPIYFLTREVVKQNDLKTFKSYVESHEEIKEYVTEIDYDYDLDLQIYSTNHEKYTRIHPNHFNLFENENGKKNASLETNTEKTPVFEQLLNNEEVLKDKYEVIAGTMPKEYNELVLVIGKNNVVSDSILYAMDIKDRNELGKLLEQTGTDKIKSTSYTYEDILNLSYQLVLNTDYYQYENGKYKDYSKDTEYMTEVVKNGIPIKIVGILRAREEDTRANFIGYKSSLKEYVIHRISQTDIYKKQIENPEINVLTNEKFDGMLHTYEENCHLLGIASLDNPSKIEIYPKDFASKEKIISFIDLYNETQKGKGENEKIVHYTDLIKTVISGVTSIVNIISFVLIGFVAISLLVSSIMIAIITYISVLERTKEIGILRAIGASKKDVIRVFKAETIIEGLIAGILGIGITLCICTLMNVIVAHLTAIHSVARLPFGGAVFLIVLSVLLNVIAGSIPSNMASRKKPVEALRGE